MITAGCGKTRPPRPRPSSACLPPMPGCPFLRLAAAVALAPLVLTAASAADPWSLVETGRDNGHRLAVLRPPAATAGPAAPDAIVLQPGERFQEMVGFGGALTESS